MEREYNDLITSIILMALSIVMFIEAFNIKALTDSVVGAGFMPKIIAGVIAIMSVFVFVSGLKRRKVEEVEEETPVSDHEETDNKNGYIYLILTMIFLFFYLLLLPILGFLIVTAAYLIIQMLLFSEWTIRNVIQYSVISIATSSIIYFLFRNAFYVMLPAGILD